MLSCVHKMWVGCLVGDMLRPPSPLWRDLKMLTGMHVVMARGFMRDEPKWENDYRAGERILVVQTGLTILLNCQMWSHDVCPVTKFLLTIIFPERRSTSIVV